MQNMRCLAIGVSDAPPLEYLQGAENGAKAFGAWAKSLGIPTEIITDEMHPAGFDTVKAAFGRLFTGKPRISRLLIYFAGHGLARDAAEDLWLLSEWSTTERAVSVRGLCYKLVRYGVEQLTIVSDACRSPAASAVLFGDPVLDRGSFDSHVPLTDMLHASSAFHAAYMVRGSTPEEDRCIFSGLLNEALSGAHDTAFEAPERLRITNFSLADFLNREVPLRAGQYQVELRPDITTGLRPPDNIYLAARPATPPTTSQETEVAVAQLRPGVLSAEARYDLAARLRDEKEHDPVRGVIAAYIYDSLGDLDSVRRVAYYLALASVPVPYDVALLGHLTASRSATGPIAVEIPETPKRTRRSAEEEDRSWTFAATPRVPFIGSQAPRVAGAFPWLRQGWLLLEDEDPSALIIDGLAELRAELLPSPFTTLKPGGGQRLKAMIESV
jgi:hypothetical protein